MTDLYRLACAFEDLAAQYVREIRILFPRGPYLLCGYSVAGLLAWEVAQQLHAMEQRVALLALLDTHVYNNPARPPERASTLERFSRRVEFHVDVLRSLPLKDRLAYIPRLLRARWRRGPRAALPGTGRPEPAALRDEGRPPFWRMVLGAGRAYIPRPYPGPLAVFLVKQHDLNLDIDPRRPGSLAAGRVEIHRVPGSHATFLTAPHVRVLAAIFRECLDRAIGLRPRRRWRGMA